MEAGQIDWDLTFKAQRQQKLCTLYAGVSCQIYGGLWVLGNDVHYLSRSKKNHQS